MTDDFEHEAAVLAHEAATDPEKHLIGLYQEVLLREDDSGGPNMIWFGKAVSAVKADPNTVVTRVALGFKVSPARVRKECGL